MQDDLFAGTGETPRAHRLFFALLPAPAQRHLVAAAVDPLRAHFPAARWVRPQRWHLTQHYLGESDRRRDDLIAAATQAADGVQASAFGQVLDGLGLLGNPRQPALALVAPAASPGLSEFRQALRERLLRAGFRLPGGGFLPHLTLAYVPPQPSLPPPVPVALRFDAFHLLQSVEGQADYEILASWPLA